MPVVCLDLLSRTLAVISVFDFLFLPCVLLLYLYTCTCSFVCLVVVSYIGFRGKIVRSLVLRVGFYIFLFVSFAPRALNCWESAHYRAYCFDYYRGWVWGGGINVLIIIPPRSNMPSYLYNESSVSQ